MKQGFHDKRFEYFCDGGYLVPQYITHLSQSPGKMNLIHSYRNYEFDDKPLKIHICHSRHERWQLNSADDEAYNDLLLLNLLPRSHLFADQNPQCSQA